MQKIGMQRSSFASSSDLRPLKRVNSILTPPLDEDDLYYQDRGLNPLKRVNSILTLRDALNEMLEAE